MNKYNLFETLSIKLDPKNDIDNKTLKYISDDRLLPNININFNRDKIMKNDKYNLDELSKYYNNTLKNYNLKRACCLRENENVDTYGENENFFIELPDFKNENNLGYITTKVVMNDLKNKCKNLDLGNNKKKVDFKGRGTNNCDEFFKTYCKTNAGSNYNSKFINNNDELLRKIKYSDGNEAMECSCLNSPLLNEEIFFHNKPDRKHTNIDDRNIIFIDNKCGKSLAYQTSEQQKEDLKRTSITICSQSTNIGSAQNVEMSGNVTKQDCGNTYTGVSNDKKTDISDKKTDISDKKTDISDKKTDTNDKKTNISDKKTDISDKKTDISDKKTDNSNTSNTKTNTNNTNINNTKTNTFNIIFNKIINDEKNKNIIFILFIIFVIIIIYFIYNLFFNKKSNNLQSNNPYSINPQTFKSYSKVLKLNNLQSNIPQSNNQLNNLQSFIPQSNNQ